VTFASACGVREVAPTITLATRRLGIAFALFGGTGAAHATVCSAGTASVLGSTLFVAVGAGSAGAGCSVNPLVGAAALSSSSSVVGTFGGAGPLLMPPNQPLQIFSASNNYHHKPVPLPSSSLLLASAVAGLLLVAKRRSSATV
jgi:hypothetical protein